MIRRTCIFAFGLILIIVPTAYFFAHLNDADFLSGAYGNWFGSAAGVIAGVPLALAIARYQQSLQVRAEREAAARERDTRRQVLRAAMFGELQDDVLTVRQIQQTLVSEVDASVEFWNLVTAITAALEFTEGHRYFEALPEPYARTLLDNRIYDAYRQLRKLGRWVEVGAARHAYMVRSRPGEYAGNANLDHVRHFAGLVASEAEAVLEDLRKAPS